MSAGKGQEDQGEHKETVDYLSHSHKFKKYLFNILVRYGINV